MSVPANTDNFFGALSPETSKTAGNGAGLGGGSRPKMASDDFLDRVVPWPDDNNGTGYVNLHVASIQDDGAKIWWGKPCRTKHEFRSMLARYQGMPGRKDFYFCTSLQSEAAVNKQGKPAAVRSSENALSMSALKVDLDAKEYKSIEEAEEAIADVLVTIKMPPPSLIVASSDKGRHLYWPLTARVDPAQWGALSNALKNALLKHGLKFDAGCTTDASRILRLPGTKNHKTVPPTDVKLIHNDPADFEIKALEKILAPYSAPAVEGQSAKAAAAGAVSACAWKRD